MEFKEGCIEELLKNIKPYYGRVDYINDNEIIDYDIDPDEFSEDGYLGDGVYLSDIKTTNIYTLNNFLNKLYNIYFIDLLEDDSFSKERKIISKYFKTK